MDLAFQREVKRAVEAVKTDPDWMKYFDFDSDGTLDDLELGILQTVVTGEVKLADGEPAEWLKRKGRSIIEDRYRVLGHLSSGGQADTELAYDHRLQTAVVLKRIRLDQLHEWKTLELFRRESDVLKKLNHPCIPRFRDAFPIGDPPHTFCIVQEFITGNAVSYKLEKGGLYSAEQVTDMLSQLFSILEYIHGHEPPVVHRDIKPANLILDENDQLFLIDFGAASQKTATPEGGSTVVGTHGYMPLEQYMGVVTAATDLYASGATALHMLTGTAPGQMPFSNGAIQFETFIDDDSELLPVIRALLEPVAEDRPADVAAARKILREGKRTDVVVSKNPLVEQDKSWLLKAKRANTVTHYLDGERPFRITVRRDAILIQEESDGGGAFLVAVGIGVAVMTSYLVWVWLGIGIAVATLVYNLGSYRRKMFLQIEDGMVRWGAHAVSLDRIQGCKAKRAKIILNLTDRDVELHVPARTHEQAIYVAEQVTAKISEIQERSQPDKNEKLSNTDSTPPAT